MVEDREGRRERIEATTKVWAAGVRANPLTRTLAEQTGAPLDRDRWAKAVERARQWYPELSGLDF